MSNDGMWEQENRELRLENERLREDWRVISQEKAVLLKRIEELEKELLHEMNANEMKGQCIEEVD